MSKTARVGIIGDYDAKSRWHRATCEALSAAAKRLSADLAYEWVPTDSLAGRASEVLGEFDGLWASPGSPYRSLEGALEGIRFARERGRPFVAT